MNNYIRYTNEQLLSKKRNTLAKIRKLAEGMLLSKQDSSFHEQDLFIATIEMTKHSNTIRDINNELYERNYR
jgi:hypothetical protein